MSTPVARRTPFEHLWQLLAPRPKDVGQDFEEEVRRLGVLGLQFAAFVAIILAGVDLFFAAAWWYLKKQQGVAELVQGNIENFGLLIIGISALSLSRTTLGKTYVTLVVISCALLADGLLTATYLMRGNLATYPPFVISLLILAAVVPLQPLALAAVGLAMLALHLGLHWWLLDVANSVSGILTSFPVVFYLTIILVCTGLTTVIYHLRVKNFQNLQALQSSQGRLQKELAVAGFIQMNSLPRQDPVISGLTIAGTCLSATEVGGDYYDYLSVGDGKLGVVVGDVSGKGTSAALYMSRLQGIMRALHYLHDSPVELLARVNDLIHGHIEKNSFITLTYALFDLSKRRMTICRAGHLATLYVQSNGHHFLIPRGLGIGLAPREVFENHIEEAVLSLGSRELLIFYSDGLTEARNLAGEEYGETRLVKLVTGHRELEPRPLIEKIMEDVKKFISYAKQHDDMTVLVAKMD